jgi:hypothetical protein
MDNARLDQLLRVAGSRQFWLKPVGIVERPIVINGRVREGFGEAELEILFAKPTDDVQLGDILIVYRVEVSAVMYVAERLPEHEWTTPEDVYLEGVRERWAYWFKARNLTPEFGENWRRFMIKPFTLAQRLNPGHPNDPAQIGIIQYGNDRARIPQWFAEEIIQQIQSATLDDRV